MIFNTIQANICASAGSPAPQLRPAHPCHAWAWPQPNPRRQPSPSAPALIRFAILSTKTAPKPTPWAPGHWAPIFLTPPPPLSAPSAQPPPPPTHPTHSKRVKKKTEKYAKHPPPGDPPQGPKLRPFRRWGWRSTHRPHKARFGQIHAPPCSITGWGSAIDVS